MKIDAAAVSAPGYTSPSATSHSKNQSHSVNGNLAKPDIVAISDEARALASGLPDPVSTGETGQIYSAGKTLEKDSGVAAAGNRLRKYLNLGAGTGDTSLLAMNISRKSLAKRIDSALKKAGITLSEEEKLAISLDSDNKIVVGGLEDKQKAKKIQDALNDDKKLADEMRKHAASGKLNEAAKKQDAYETFMRENGIDPSTLDDSVEELFTNDGIRAFIVDDYLKMNAGISLEDLRLETAEDGSKFIAGITDQLSTLMAEDGDLGATIAKVLESGKPVTDFEVSFEYANGAISDSATMDAAKDKIQGVKDKLMGYYDKETGEMVPGIIDLFREKLEKVGGDYEEDFMKALSRGFSIRVDTQGTFEIVGYENMDAKLLDTLEGLVQQAMDQWAADKKDYENVRVANMADVADAYIEQHRFEHGDVDKHKHMVQINFAGAGSHSDIKVVSPEADAAQDAENQRVAGELGEQLRTMLGEQGVDAGNLEMEIDKAGKITVLGDPRDPNVQKAQTILDQFAKEAKAEGLAGMSDEDRREKEEVAAERRSILRGEAETEEAQPKTTAAGGAESTDANDDDADGPTEPDRRGLMAENWKKAFPKYETGRMYMSAVRPTSPVAKPQYAVHVADGKGLHSTAKALYRELLNGMTQFHDERRAISYSLSAA